ncbi:MAG: hypothetical protein VB142_01080 [Burkholderia sp.]
MLAPGSAASATPRAASAPLANAPQARPFSLQQLFALKNRVLMELQLHGIGKLVPDRAAPATGPAAVPSQAVPASAAAALILGFAFRCRKRAEPDNETALASTKPELSVDSATDEAAAQATRAAPEAPAPIDHRDHESTPPAAPAEPSSLTELNKLTHPVSSNVPVHEFTVDAVSMLDSLDMPLLSRSGLPNANLDFASHNATNGLPDPRLPTTGLAQLEAACTHEAGEQKGDLHASSATHVGTDFSDEELSLDDEPSQSIPEHRPASGFAPFSAAQFRVLNLDFGLDLPADPGATLPSPTEAARAMLAKLADVS